ncbi:MAG: helix-turn-helix transcriptional regulator [Oscillospiraceae bacterium]
MDIRILTCIADGLSIQKTAQKLNINFETLRSRIKEIYRKMGVKNKTEAVMAAKELNLI